MPAPPQSSLRGRTRSRLATHPITQRSTHVSAFKCYMHAQGLRVTDEATLEVAEMVLCGKINKEVRPVCLQAHPSLLFT
jgi:hypothetical protein